MSDNKIVVTIKKCIQVSPDDFEMKAISAVFSTDKKIKDILDWAKSTGFSKNPKITDLYTSEYSEAKP